MTRLAIAMPLLVAMFLSGGAILGAEPRLPIPDMKLQATAELTIKELYKADYGKRAPGDRVALAAKLLKLAGESAADPTSQFVLLSQARDLAAQGGAIATAFAAIDSLGAAFEVDAATMRLSTLTAAAQGTKTPQANAELSMHAMRVCDDADSADLLDDAARSAAIAVAAADKSRDRALIAMARQRTADVERARLELPAFAAAIKRLAQTPADSAANTAAGRYLCFTRGNWNKGLPYLSHGIDAPLATLAASELKPPASPVELKRLGDDWWQWAEKAEHDDAPRAKSRAAFWYAKAIPDLAGIARSIAEKRVAEVNAADGNGKRVVNLMTLIDPARDASTGKWSFKGGILVTDGLGVCKLRINYEPPSEYDFRITFVRRGTDAITQTLSQGGHKFVFSVGSWGNKVAGFEHVDGRRVGDNASTARSEAWTQPDVKQTSVVHVRRDTLSAEVNGKTISKITTDYKNLSIPGEWDLGEPVLGIGSFGTKVEFLSVELVELTGQGKRVTAPAK